ncbi:MAG: Bug family tripartite tricarboxylate transporter substrate binding protein [Xanthobacteraceae bacterium]
MQRALRLLTLTTAIALCVAPSHAQEYPTREIRLVCGFVAGSGADVIHRYFAEKLKALIGKPVIVENKPGASGNLAHSYVAKAKPDGYTVYPVGGTALAASLYLFKNAPVDPLKDFDPLTALLKQPWTLVVDAKSPFKTVPELTAYLKEKKNKASYSTATTTGTIVGELYKSIAGLETVQVNYKTIGDSLNDLQSGAVDFAMADAAFALGQAKNGNVRILAVSSGQRSKSMANIPTMAESGVPGLDITVWWAVQLPAGTPKPIADKLQGWFTEILDMPETEQFLANIGTDVFKTTPAQTRALLEQEIKNWAEYARLAKIDPT